MQGCARYAIALCAIAVIVTSFGPISTQAQGEHAKPNVPTDATPRTPDGKIDLSGYWGRLIGDGAKNLEGGAADIHAGGGGNGTLKSFADWLTNFEKDAELNRRAQTNRPIYKPEYWGKIRKIDWDNSRANDPQSSCKPSVPRLGIPQKIVQSSNEIIFFY